jgi:hypothetical protein
MTSLLHKRNPMHKVQKMMSSRRRSSSTDESTDKPLWRRDSQCPDGEEDNDAEAELPPKAAVLLGLDGTATAAKDAAAASEAELGLESKATAAAESAELPPKAAALLGLYGTAAAAAPPKANAVLERRDGSSMKRLSSPRLTFPRRSSSKRDVADAPAVARPADDAAPADLPLPNVPARLDFGKTLEDGAGAAALLAFADSEFSSENILFLQEATQWRRDVLAQAGTWDYMVGPRAHEIIEQFVKDGSGATLSRHSPLSLWAACSVARCLSLDSHPSRDGDQPLQRDRHPLAHAARRRATDVR